MRITFVASLSRRLVYVQNHIHEKGGRVKVHRLATAGTQAKLLRHIGPMAGMRRRWATAARSDRVFTFARRFGRQGLPKVPARASRARKEIKQGDDQVKLFEALPFAACTLRPKVPARAGGRAGAGWKTG